MSVETHEKYLPAHKKHDICSRRAHTEMIHRDTLPIQFFSWSSGFGHWSDPHLCHSCSAFSFTSQKHPTVPRVDHCRRNWRKMETSHLDLKWGQMESHIVVKELLGL